MKRNDSIRQRIVLASFTLACVIATIFSVGLYIAFDTTEDKLFDKHMEADVDAFMSIYRLMPQVGEIARDNFQVFITESGRSDTLPDYLRGLEADADEVIIDGREFELHQRIDGGNTLYFLFDEGEIEEFEQTLLFAMALIVTLVIAGAAWAGSFVAERIIRPLSDLSQQVDSLDRKAASHIALDTNDDADDEIASLASAINGYHLRISELLMREREFSADVSHELRTPVTVIQGAAEIMERDLAQERRAPELVARIKRGCLQMTTLIDALLYLARDPASFAVMIETVSLKHVVGQQVSAIGELAAKKGINVQVKDTDDTVVEAVPAVVQIVIGNILKNAVKYTDHKVINIIVGAHGVVIQDYGPGIDDVTQKGLFERFSRGSAVRSDVDGSGIGLALVRRFCEQYGWRLQLQSDRDSGTRVAVVF